MPRPVRDSITLIVAGGAVVLLGLIVGDLIATAWVDAQGRPALLASLGGIALALAYGIGRAIGSAFNGRDDDHDQGDDDDTAQR